MGGLGGADAFCHHYQRCVTRPRTFFRRYDAIPPGGTVPAHPGLPGHPMNDAVLQNPSQTRAEPLIQRMSRAGPFRSCAAGAAEACRDARDEDWG